MKLMTNGTPEDGRTAQYEELMQALAQLQSKYKGVRGQLLAKVREAFAPLKPAGRTGDRAMQHDEMMEALAQLQSKYKGVRGQLLAKVREEFERLKPTGRSKPAAVKTAPPASPPSAANSLPSCRACGRTMRMSATEGTLVCQNGHTRLVA